jgi:hypothetical protein
MSLSEVILDYWKVSKAYNRRPDASNISVSKAMKVLGAHLDVPYWKHVHFRVYALREGIIIGKPYCARASGTYLGYFATPEEAHQAYLNYWSSRQ